MSNKEKKKITYVEKLLYNLWEDRQQYLFISSFLLCSFPLFFIHTLHFRISFLLCLSFLSFSVFCPSVSLSLSFYRRHSLYFSLCLSGTVWLVLIYSHHYLVLGEDKHAFACLMNQTPLIPLSMRTHTNTQLCTYTHVCTHTLLLLALQASVSLSLT